MPGKLWPDLPPQESSPLLQPPAPAGGRWKLVLVGAGFLADAYDLFVIDLVIAILHRLHPTGFAAWEKSLIASATLVGALTGQLFFGVVGDVVGRKWSFVTTCVLISAGALLSGCVMWTDASSSFGLVPQLAACRFLLGVGVGGEYPLAASLAAEGSSAASRGRFVASVFSMQGWGMLLSSVVVLACLAARMPLECVWRTALALGAVPSLSVVYMRTRMEDSAIYTNAKREAASEGVSVAALATKYLRSCWRPLVGTTLSWLLLDITFYGTGSFKSRIADMLADPVRRPDVEEIWGQALFSLACGCLAIPGYLLSVAFIDSIGRYRLQLWGFVAMAANFFLIASLAGGESAGAAWRWLLLVLFGLTFLFSNFGPNTTTFVIPTEAYPTLIRSSCHGLSSAAGKLGAVIGAAGFSPLERALGLGWVLAGCGLVSLAGAVVTFFFTSSSVVELSDLDSAAGVTAKHTA